MMARKASRNTTNGMELYNTCFLLLSYIDYSVSFRRAMDLQINQFVKAIETENVNEYMPVIIR